MSFEDITQSISRALTNDPAFSLKNANDRVMDVPVQLVQAFADKMSLGVGFLDDYLIGILPTDLVLIGAKTGVGKTQLCTLIASNACHNKRVLFIALEAEENEVEMRLLYAIEANLYYRDRERVANIRVDYRSWRFGMIDPIIARYRPEALRIFKERYKNIKTLYRNKNFNSNDLFQVLEQHKDDCDLVVLDHFSYMDIEENGEQWNMQKKLIKEIRTMNLHYKIPMVVACHVKKNTQTFIPDIDDFEGTGHIGKNCTIAIMVQPAPNGYNPVEKIAATLMSVPKCRTGGAGKFVGTLFYSLQYEMYSPKYELQRVINRGQDIEPLPLEEYPEWAQNMKKFSASQPT